METKNVKISWDIDLDACEYRVEEICDNSKRKRIVSIYNSKIHSIELQNLEINVQKQYDISYYHAIDDIAECVKVKHLYVRTDGHHDMVYSYYNPKIVNISVQDNKYTITWNRVEDVFRYRLYHWIKGSKWNRVADIENNNCYSDVIFDEFFDSRFVVRGLDKNNRFITDYNLKGTSVTEFISMH